MCLHSAKTVNLREAVEVSEEKIASLIREAVFLKPHSHNLTEKDNLDEFGFETENFSMCQIGG